ncbi:DUF6037 family protein [Capnocytophaga sp.]|uniref:DUF6037 family protein n=1 Tax=Capnocytophaga sp. TaxID=44737 RepID=UPI0026DB6BEC|nr:DUF6037 family protein [Capnocytophaga sp.]MDO5106138.1 DUF6037 family protein [Capnocytophaga sp.]
MAEVLFKNLPYLLNDMKKKKWIIDSFFFSYNNVETIVVLRTFQDGEKKPNDYAKASVEFIRANDIGVSIGAYIDFFRVYFDTPEDFFTFFNINRNGSYKDLFFAFAKCFANFIPQEKVIDKKTPTEKTLLGSRCEKNNRNAIYCYDIRRNGVREDGTNNKRSIENSNKAQILRPILYEKFSVDLNLSFFFSENKEDELTDEAIAMKIANRRY